MRNSIILATTTPRRRFLGLAGAELGTVVPMPAVTGAAPGKKS